ncbi:uncharacterized protein Ecym_8418 [Eremothecium cymbalariae DBVPG|uniref:ATP-dependent bile acid permease n=1 Tax=Eremothecium cymbalariae (strain CBS 270.75 / DBVPG 7215 / KCTC 17166 / NRRL Y-17582) TaxID=931890 RepID=G8JXW3_ERECY|nr:Hypothetical protein Ecym_8418 [Eremothecium cymbalariae DBVPG\
MAVNGGCPLWEHDDITECGRLVYIDYYVPVGVLCVFASVVGYRVVRSLWVLQWVTERRWRQRAVGEGEQEPLVARGQDGGRRRGRCYASTVGDGGDGGSCEWEGKEPGKRTQSLMEEHFSIENLRLEDSHGNPHGVAEVVRRGLLEKCRTVVECLLCLVQVCLHCGVLVEARRRQELQELFPENSTVVRLGLWVCLAGTCLLRLGNVNQNVQWIGRLGNLWALSFVSYFGLFVASVLPFRSVCLGSIDSVIGGRYYKSQFFLDLGLFLLLFTANIRNELAVLYHTSPGVVPSPEPIASLASFISWSWVDKFIWNAHLRRVEFKDIWGLRMDDYSIFVAKRFHRYVLKKRVKRSITRNLIGFLSTGFTLQCLWGSADALMTFVPTILLKRVLEYVDDPSRTPKNVAWFYVFGMFISRLTVTVFQGQALFTGRRICIRLKSLVISEIYNKALRRSISVGSGSNASSQSSSQVTLDLHGLSAADEIDGDEKSKPANLGAIINLMAVDSIKVSQVSAYIHMLLESVVMAIVAMVLLYRLLGWSALVGATFIICILPINLRFATKLGELQEDALACTDRRIQKLNETLQAIRIIKFFAWEDKFESDVQKIREMELSVMLRRVVVWSLSSFVWYITPTLVASASFCVYIYVQGEVLTTPVAFTALSLFVLLRNPLDQLCDIVFSLVQCSVSLRRIQNFLDQDETPKYRQLTVKKDRLGFSNATIGWDHDSATDFKLKNLNIDFKIGKLNVIVGPTGSGKTSLLMGLLGEINLSEGKIYVPALNPREDLVVDADGMTDSIGYCSQSAWLLNDTLRNNILFSAPYEANRYNAVIHACGLTRDLEILNAGDQTEVGEKGITLSGGQKQRVSLARAMYSRARHILLDDCLSAVDSHTAQWIYKHCITGPLMEGRTCVLVSHNTALTLKNADWVVILENAKVTAQGEPLELFNRGLLGEDDLLKSSLMSTKTSSVNLKRMDDNRSDLDLGKLHKKISKEGISSINGATQKSVPETDEDRAKRGKLIKEEVKQEGVVGLDVYMWYGKIFGRNIFLFLFFVFLLEEFISMRQSWWLRTWASTLGDGSKVSILTGSASTLMSHNFASLKHSTDNAVTILSTILRPGAKTLSTTTRNTFYYLSIYILLGTLRALISTVKVILSYISGLKASRKIFTLLLKKVLYAKLRFFDSTPTGRIMNRFSRDVEAIDEELIPFFEGAFASLVQCITTILLIGYITPVFLFFAIVICVSYYIVGYFYLVGSRELQRFESITKSPIHQHFSETLVGVTTIRAFGDERRFLADNLSKVDTHNRPFFYLWVTNRWLAFRIDFIGAFVILASGIFILLNVNSLDAGLAGISLIYAISFTEGALWLVRLYSNVEMTMNSVERLKEYMKIEQEPSTGLYEPPPEWPDRGKIEVNNLSLRYASNLPKVIKNVTFTVEPQSKVGIVGRTGAGKSTIITALFRFLDPDTGTIKLDNVDITSIRLKRLRQSITIIPQDPVLFAGTIKSNLDPYSEYADDRIFEALKRVNLIVQEELTPTDIPSSSSSLSFENVNKFLDLTSEITEGGSNLSQGQRQLVCLARSLLRNPKAILLDEATASIDYASDAKIQQTIREEFSGSTILTIAHRLRSIIDYDKVLVIDSGELAEYDHPYTLLLNKGSLFYRMCEDSDELEALIQLAKEAFVKKLNSRY